MNACNSLVRDTVPDCLKSCFVLGIFWSLCGTSWYCRLSCDSTGSSV